MKRFNFSLFFLFTLLISSAGTSNANAFFVVDNTSFTYDINFENGKIFNFYLEPERLCVRYKTNSGWSKNYSVEVRTLSGSELNDATSSFDYKYYANYAVIFWGENQASVIELRSYFGSYSTIATKGKDQNGREWELKKTSYC